MQDFSDLIKTVSKTRIRNCILRAYSQSSKPADRYQTKSKKLKKKQLQNELAYYSANSFAMKYEVIT